MEFYNKIVMLCREKGINPSKMADDIGISRSAPKNWAEKGTIPDEKTIKKIADYFGVPVDYLAGKPNGENKNDQTDNDDFRKKNEYIYLVKAMKVIYGRALSKDEEEIVKLYVSLDREHRKELHALMVNFARKKKRKDAPKDGAPEDDVPKDYASKDDTSKNEK